MYASCHKIRVFVGMKIVLGKVLDMWIVHISLSWRHVITCIEPSFYDMNIGNSKWRNATTYNNWFRGYSRCHLGKATKLFSGGLPHTRLRSPSRRAMVPVPSEGMTTFQSATFPLSTMGNLLGPILNVLEDRCDFLVVKTMFSEPVSDFIATSSRQRSLPFPFGASFSWLFRFQIWRF